MNEQFYQKLGKNIKKIRDKNKLTQQQLADKSGIGLIFMGKIEVAYSKPSLETLINIAEALNLTVSDLTSFEC